MVRVYGRCRRGERLVCKTPWGHWKTTTFTCGLRCDGLVAPWVLEGPMTGDAFLIYVEKVLVPTLSPGDTVIIDNLSSHKVASVREAIEAVGARLIYLPPYSPDPNPIELAFAKFKTGLRKAAERTVDDLWRRIGVLIDDFSPQECRMSCTRQTSREDAPTDWRKKRTRDEGEEMRATRLQELQEMVAKLLATARELPRGSAATTH